MNSIHGPSALREDTGVVLLVSPTCAAVAPSRLGVRGPVLTTSDPYAASVALLTGDASALVVDVTAPTAPGRGGHGFGRPTGRARASLGARRADPRRPAKRRRRRDDRGGPKA